MSKLKHFLNTFHIWRFHLQLWDALNDQPAFHFSYQPPGYWTPVSDPKAIEALRLDDELGLVDTEQVLRDLANKAYRIGRGTEHPTLHQVVQEAKAALSPQPRTRTKEGTDAKPRE